MFAAIGLVVLFAMVFGGFALAGGNLQPVLNAIPHEMIIIGGSAVGALLIGNNFGILKAVGGGIAKVFKGPSYNRKDYLDTIFLTSKLMKTMKTDGPVAMEAHIEDPKSSSIFQEYPKLLKDHFLIDFMADAIRLVVVSSGTLNVHAVEEIMDNALKTHHHSAIKPVKVLQTTGDALPALGIVAAVLGVIKTMGSIDQPPAILGGMIGAALVGTFLGVFLAYGIVSPISNRLEQILEEDGEIYHVAKAIIISSLHGNAPAMVIEAARTSISSKNQPGFAEVFDGLRAR
ncbi:flagellar motor stator protein MotA [Sphingosinicella soli]|uniref:Chemotaxis protein MotA n=1 Tax=Sphingosinicella soli TaxID=333708 RepID=A0A7W7B2K2_9SPHN|nr:flagellar motor stator protein MotA [Sphingosinicella soli]MBB4632847.1 chemotaxis protein MotA [Sphingosinicella soli]